MHRGEGGAFLVFPDDFNKQALELIQEKKYNEAAVLLRDAVHSMPDGWKPIETTPAGTLVRAWSGDEFAAYSAWHSRAGLPGEPKWESPSYSHAWYLLAAIYVDHEQYDDALRLLATGTQLERDHPDLLCEGGFVLHRVGDLDAALKAYEIALDARPWITPRQKARALRGSSSVLADLGRFGEAESRLVQAQELEPDNEITRRGLQYVRDRIKDAVVEKDSSTAGGS